MKLVYSRYFPFRGFHACNVCGVVFVNSRYGRMGLHELCHEQIHTEQMKELGFVLFYVLYALDYLWGLVHYLDRRQSYLNLYFEREAYANQHRLDYPRRRRHYSWVHYMLHGRKRGT